MRIDLPNFHQARVLVVGDVILDRYWHGNTNRISPEAPVPVVHIKQEEFRVGGAGNVALNVASLGCQVSLLGLVGTDNNAEMIQTQLHQHKVTSHLLAVENLPTITKLRVMSQHQQLLRLDFEEGFANYDFTEFMQTYTNLLSQVDVVILSDYAKGTLQNSRKLIDLANKYNVKILVDPKSTDLNRYYGATLITPNQHEFEMIVGKCNSETKIVAKAEDLLKQYNLDAILVTRGAHGMSLIQANQHEKALHLPTRAREVFDVTGAGDTVIAVLGSALACKLPLSEAMFLANISAGIVVGKLGTATVTLTELRRALQRKCDSSAGILSEEDLLQEVIEAKANNETIVMTNGCFDILHAGHVAYLEQAKSLGQRLIVAVNDDDSVRHLKGNLRPINPLEQRMKVLSALRAVDWVVSFSEDTPERLISTILPNILVKGGDYQVNKIAGATQVIANGGKVEILSFVDGCSTSKILAKQSQERQ